MIDARRNHAACQRAADASDLDVPFALSERWLRPNGIGTAKSGADASLAARSVP
jgi:hypothetical protein